MTVLSPQPSPMAERKLAGSGLPGRAAKGVGMRGWLGTSQAEATLTQQSRSPGRLYAELDRLEARGTAWLARHSILLLRVGLGIVFFWFGVLKFFPDASPAQDLAGRTIDVLTLGLVPPEVSLRLLATVETLIGLGLISGLWLRVALLALLLQMLGTLTPLVLFPALTFARPPYAPTMEGQYILKNIVLVAAAMVIGATVRGGRIVADPKHHAFGHEPRVRLTSPRRSREASVVIVGSHHRMSSSSGPLASAPAVHGGARDHCRHGD